jgi:DNA polymerase III subunit epsilon
MPDYDFIALDFETANQDYWSICQIGMAYFKDNILVDQWQTLVNPQTHFSDINTSIHGITEKAVVNSITLHDAYDLLDQKLHNQIVAHHTHFDRSACCRCATHTNKDLINCSWVDTAMVARATWKEVERSGYGLVPLTTRLGLSFENHHNAMSDAIAAGEILIKASQYESLPIDVFVKRFSRTVDEKGKVQSSFINPNSNDKKLRDLANTDPNPDGVMFGEVVVFTGALSIPRLEAAEMAYKLGCNVDMGVTKNTTILVVGQQDLDLLAGYSKSSKHRKAEELIKKGQLIRIMSENDFNGVFLGL